MEQHIADRVMNTEHYGVTWSRSSFKALWRYNALIYDRIVTCRTVD